MASDKSHQTLLQQFTTWAKNPQFSAVLPLSGMAAGEIAYLLRRKNLSPEERAKANIQDLLLGGLAGTGLELTRLGGAGFASTAADKNHIPKGVEGYAVNENLKR